MHAKLRRGNTSRRGTRPGVETTHQTTRQHTRRHRCGGRRRDWRARLRRPLAAAGPGRATSGRPTLQTSSNQRNSNHLTRTPVTNVVNPSPKTAIISEKALRLTTFVTTGQKSTQKTPWSDDVCNNTRRATSATRPHWCGGRRRDWRARLRCPWAVTTPPPDNFRMQFPHSMNRHNLKNRRISTIRSQTPTCVHGNCMRNC